VRVKFLFLRKSVNLLVSPILCTSQKGQNHDDSIARDLIMRIKLINKALPHRTNKAETNDRRNSERERGKTRANAEREPIILYRFPLKRSYKEDIYEIETLPCLTNVNECVVPIYVCVIRMREKKERERTRASERKIGRRKKNGRIRETYFSSANSVFVYSTRVVRRKKPRFSCICTSISR